MTVIKAIALAVLSGARWFRMEEDCQRNLVLLLVLIMERTKKNGALTFTTGLPKPSTLLTYRC